jgi:hypothetical protein
MTPLQAGYTIESKFLEIEREAFGVRRVLQAMNLCPDDQEAIRSSLIEIISLAESALKTLNKVEFTQ